MTCPALIDPVCIIQDIGHGIGALGATVAGDALNTLAADIQKAEGWLIANSITWWVRSPSPDLVTDPVTGTLQRWLLPITAAVAVFGLMVSGIKMAVTAKANPLVTAGGGLITLAATSAVGVLLPTLLLQAGDAFSTWVLNGSTGGQVTQRLGQVMTLTGAPTALVVVLGIIAIIISAMQWMLMLFRQGSLIILAGILPLTAAGTVTTATRPWFKRTTGWMLALIFYKPAASMIYAVAFEMIGNPKGDTTVIGFAMIGMSLLALPVLMKFFTQLTGQVSDAAGGGGITQTALSGAVAFGALRSPAGGLGAASAADQARQTTANLGPAGGGPPAAPQGAATASAGGIRQAASSGSAQPGPGAGTAGHGPGPQPRPAAGTSAGTGGSAGQAAGAGRASGGAAAGGPAGMAAAGLAAGASRARQAAAASVQPPPEQGAPK